MSSRRRVIFIAYPGVELLDIAGPAAVFSSANVLSGRPLYQPLVAAPECGDIKTQAGLLLNADGLEQLRFNELDTVLVVGAYRDALRAAMANGVILRALQAAEAGAERIGSICTGAFVLAAAGLLEGRRVTTHWEGRERLARFSPGCVVDSDALYVRDGALWTSAGVAAGIDMALAMVERDHGTRLKSEIARQLVVYAHRPGYQSQFSALLSAQVRADERYGSLVRWLSERLDRTTKVSEMAGYLGQSERSFYRHFVAEFGQTPSKFLERLKLDAGRELIETGAPVKVVTAQVGFRSESAFRSAFKAHFGVSPVLYARMHKRSDG